MSRSPGGAAPGTAPSRVPFFGWRVVVLCAITLGMTAPGQTVGVSVFIDPMMEGLGLSRSQVSGAYLVGTLSGAVTMPWFGRLLDRRGPRFTLTVIVLGFAAVLAAMSGVVGLVTLTLGFVGIRMLGQGALSMTATTTVAYWFDRHRGRAIGISSAAGQGMMTIAPLSLAALVAGIGWRQAWLVAAGVVGGVCLLIARLGIPDSPSAVGQHVDGRMPEEGEPPARPWGVKRREAARSRMFWALTGGVFTTGLIGTAMAFHQISILGEQGLTPIQAAANFIPQTVAGLLATLGTGALVDHLRPRWVLAASMTTLSGAVLMLPLVGPDWTAILFGAAIGAAGGSARALEAAALPRFFGTVYLGSIRGTVMALTVVGTAIGPLVLALGHAASGSYVPALRWLLVLPAVVVVLGLTADAPTRPSSPTVEGPAGRSG
jgi:MFS family permease